MRSARYALDAGGEKGDAANNERLLRELAGREDRTARFVCALVAVRGAADPEPLVAMGRWPGRILTAPRGTGGFGYDPLMFIPPLCRAVAELGAGEKNIHSHRALAAGELVRQMREVWKLG